MTSRKVGSSSTTSTRTWREALGVVAWGFGVEFGISGVALRSGYCVKPFTVWAIDFGRRFNRTLVRCSPERKSQRGRGDVLACRTDHSPPCSGEHAGPAPPGQDRWRTALSAACRGLAPLRSGGPFPAERPARRSPVRDCLAPGGGP